MILFGFLLSAIMYFVVYGAYILVISFTVWMAIDAAKQDRFWWITIIIGVPVIGPAVYYFTEKKHHYVKVSPHHIHESLTEVQHESAPKKKVSRKAKVDAVPEIKKEEIQEVIQ